MSQSPLETPKRLVSADEANASVSSFNVTCPFGRVTLLPSRQVQYASVAYRTYWLINWSWPNAISVAGSTIVMMVVVVWHNGSVLVSINAFTLHRPRLVLGWVTVAGSSRVCTILVFIINHPGQLSLAIPPRVDEMSTGHNDDHSWEETASCTQQ